MYRIKLPKVESPRIKPLWVTLPRVRLPRVKLPKDKIIQYLKPIFKSIEALHSFRVKTVQC